MLLDLFCIRRDYSIIVELEDEEWVSVNMPKQG